jgi:hypothetical protein
MRRVLKIQVFWHITPSSSSSSYSTTALSVWPWLPSVSEQFNFSGVEC